MQLVGGGAVRVGIGERVVIWVSLGVGVVGRARMLLVD
jgi:hypothetical protein